MAVPASAQFLNESQSMDERRLCHSSRFVVETEKEPQGSGRTPITQKLARMMSIGRSGSFTSPFPWIDTTNGLLPERDIRFHQSNREYGRSSDNHIPDVQVGATHSAKTPSSSHSNSSCSIISSLILLVALAIGYLSLHRNGIARQFTLYSGHDSLEHRLAYLEGAVAAMQKSEATLVTLVERSILRYSKDFIGRQDFALGRSGAEVLLDLTTPPPPVQRTSSSFKSKVVRNAPDVALNENLSAGSCWRFDGKSGQLGISLIEPISVTHITIDHIAKELTSTIELAPRVLVVWGAVDEEKHAAKLQLAVQTATGTAAELFASKKRPPITNGLQFVPLAWVDYNILATSHVQTFAVFDYVEALDLEFGVVVFEILDNWGAASTCIYRLRVHGKAAEGAL
ncbi:hypothetical protein BJ138DRAFT_482150 [Hygrophoropsis aurantiaca]|uniref:Uncharacterized protein n=1 Tax=Hygrophoropsis aurantiaca TaxID=72124 RepID=A0ACB8A244_9AGAM|nr:hypothetical protein BJ138DRAFT_482150 [Hygrophoropsis aurantiaca]